MKILLLTDIPPCKNYTAGLVLDQLCRFLPKGSLACFAVVNPHLDARISPDLDSVPIEYHKNPNEHAWRVLPRALGSLSALAMESYNSSITSKQIAAKAVKFGREFGADLLWCTLQGQTMIRLAVPVSRDLGIPLLTQVYDPPYWWLREHRLDTISAASVLRAFHKTLQSSAGCAAASWAMAEQYHRDYGTRTVALVPGLDARLAMPPAKRMHPGNDFVIGLAGQMYAIEEWHALVMALDILNWKLGDRNAKIQLMGRDANLHARAKMRIEFLGWHSQEEAVRLLSEGDVLYCPYWFDPNYEREARLSFPSKLTTYLAAGRPVLFHGPHYASPARFLRENEAGFLCHSLEPSEIVNALIDLASNTDLYTNLARNGRAAFDKYLTLSTMRKSFAEFLQIGEDWLSPVS